MRQTEDLDLLAQSYVLGELDGDQTERFEARLAEDQAARAAVAHAVAVAEAVAAEGPMPAQRRWPWLVAAAAAIVVAALGLRTTLDDGEPASEELISSWLEFGETDSMSFDEEDDFVAEPVAFGDTPDWLTAALEERDR